MHIVGFDLASFWVGFIAGTLSFFIFAMVVAAKSAKKRGEKYGKEDN